MKPLLELRDVKKYFELGGWSRRVVVKAVDGVSLTVSRGEVVGVIGESGSGKTTLGKIALRIYTPTSGRVIFDGTDITHIPESRLRPIRWRMQLIPQDPFASFNPLKTIGEALVEPIIIHKGVEFRDALEIAMIMLEKVGLIPPEEYVSRKPYQLSGGQVQRAAIARAMLLNPDFIVADEPTSNLDVSIRASILELLKSFKEEMKQGMMFITHDITLAKLIADRMAVMYLGKIVEIGPTKSVLEEASHPYTQALIAAIPTLDRYKPFKDIVLKGEIASDTELRGCRLYSRCPLAMDICEKEAPPMIEVRSGHLASCWLLAKK